ncbi:pilus assembly protein PilP [Pelovirga terrestris]|uniref:Pilus assembly protein PilP n=1 Tax=Pelovirga terrestris TaxID=2771352 RepID=A0A8J6UQP5_9BACT|nr:pilus assembly protein PilP [Pelovirga terrestris]MBD1399421.1 pilus assembly protein PilP [Pelovirga terrestris]
MIFYKLSVIRLFLITATSLLMILPAVALAVQDDDSADVRVSSLPETVRDYTYQPLGRRDPFTPLIRRDEPAPVIQTTRRPEALRGPLERYELGQMRLIAVVVVGGAPRAMLSTPDGKSYTVKVGDFVGTNGGRVKDIQTRKIGVDDQGVRIVENPDRIVVIEVGIDSQTGNKISELQYISL